MDDESFPFAIEVDPAEFEGTRVTFLFQYNNKLAWA